MRICIDPGHGQDNRLVGMHDPGAVYDQQRESRIVLRYAAALESACLDRRWAVKLTRRTEQTPCRLEWRLPIAKQFDADACVSLHCNASDRGEAPNGCEVLYSVHKQLAVDLSGAVAEALGVRNRGAIYRADLAVLKTADPAALIELAFMSNPYDRSRLAAPESPGLVAEAVCDVLSKHVRG